MDRSRLRLRLPALIAIGFSLAACETTLSLGYGLPDNDACRDAASQPGKPISTNCLDSLGD
jgi:hypothetical protein